MGCGRVAERAYLPALAGSPAVHLAAVVDPVAERCAAVAPGVPAFADVPALLAAVELDAVVLASPAAHHVAQAAAVAARGLPVLVEKPPAPDLDGARRLAALDPLPWLGLNRRFHPGLQRLREQAGAAPVLAVHARFAARRGDWDALTVADDALLDLGPHLVDLVTWLTRTGVAAVRATSLAHDRAVLELELTQGLATVELDRCSRYREEVELVLRGGRRLRWALPAAAPARVGARLARRPGGDPLVVSLAAQLAAFAAAATGGDPGPLATAREGVAVMAAVEAARASAAAGGAWVAAEGP